MVLHKIKNQTLKDFIFYMVAFSYLYLGIVFSLLFSDFKDYLLFTAFWYCILFAMFPLFLWIKKKLSH